METQFNHSLFDRKPIIKSKTPAVKWVKEWVLQDDVATGGKCMLFRWVREDSLKSLKDKEKEPSVPEPTTEVLFLCSYEGCGKTFIDAGALKKHSHIRGEKQFVCDYEGCGKKFQELSKLRRHNLSHTGERAHVCPIEGCGKAFSLDFNLKSHMKTHSEENYYVCKYPDCGKRYAHESKLKNHIAAQHEKNGSMDPNGTKYNTPPSEKPTKATKPSASSDRPFVCPYDGCVKDYIHEYKLNLHLKREHPGHGDENVAENAQANNNNADNEMDEASGPDPYGGKRSNGRIQKQSKPKPSLKLPPSKTARSKATATPSSVTPMKVINKKPWPVKEENYQEEDSEETEEDRDNVEDGWRRYAGNNEDDDEETEYED
ncbi:hypothetical protein K1719_021746 [Acacia pycnantha]|nr:hypothetical protein K1719_021746 [Acacia pycnantha]